MGTATDPSAEGKTNQVDLDSLRIQTPQSSGSRRGSASLTRWGSATTYQSDRNTFQGKDDRSDHLDLGADPPIESGKVDSMAREFTLQPQDGGFGAWSYVAAAFAMYIVVWGLPQSLPIFQTMLNAGPKPEFPGSVVISLLTPGIQDFQEGFLFHILPRHAKYRRGLTIIGITIMATALLLASYAEHPWQVVLFHGHLFGIGGVILNFVHVSIFPEWFDKRQTEAMGIIWTGYRLGAVASPLLCNWLLEKNGYGRTLRVLIAPMLTLLTPSIFLLRGRYPAAHVQSEPLQPRRGFLEAVRQPAVVFFLGTSTLYNAVLFAPVMFVATYGVDIGLTFSESVAALAVHNAASMLGGHLAGRLVKGTSPNSLVLGIIALSTALTHALLWGFCKDRLGLFLYAVVIGLCTGGFPHVLYPLFSEISGQDGRLYTTIHSIFSFSRSLGTMSIGPLGTYILRNSPSVQLDSFAIARYKYLVAYAFGMSMSSALLFFIRAISRKELSFATIGSAYRKIFGASEESIDLVPGISPVTSARSDE